MGLWVKENGEFSPGSLEELAMEISYGGPHGGWTCLLSIAQMVGASWSVHSIKAQLCGKG